MIEKLSRNSTYSILKENKEEVKIDTKDEF